MKENQEEATEKLLDTVQEYIARNRDRQKNLEQLRQIEGMDRRNDIVSILQQLPEECWDDVEFTDFKLEKKYSRKAIIIEEGNCLCGHHHIIALKEEPAGLFRTQNFYDSETLWLEVSSEEKNARYIEIFPVFLKVVAEKLVALQEKTEKTSKKSART